MTFKDESAARQAVGDMQGHSYQGRVLTVSTADARGTAASSANNDKDDDDDNEWKTAPPTRKNNNKNNNGKNQGKGQGLGKNKKGTTRSWDE